MKERSCSSSHNFSAFPSPGVPNYWEINVMNQRGCSSERIPQPNSNTRRRNASIAALTPFYGRTLPSKWEDAERWISSPVMGNGFSRSLQPHLQRRPKSKSGPIGSPGVSNYSHYSPAIPTPENGGFAASKLGSALSTGVLVADGVSICYGGSIERGQSYPEYTIQRLVSAPRWSNILSESPLPSFQDEKFGGSDETMDSGVISQRNMATQMSSEDFTPSSPQGNGSISSSSPSTHQSMVGKESDHCSKQEVRDVEVDKGATVMQRSKGHKLRLTEENFPHLGNLDENVAEAGASTLDIAEAAIQVSKLQREEAKITAWENLQKAKAEAAIRKLEMKLERARSSSMDKILKKLRKAQMKAHKMRNSPAGDRNQRVGNTNNFLPFHKHVWIGSLKRWFICHAS
ncbi:uncharacterized protein LOC120074722 isoform X1 [Benincasa hispida]|uniref:uncharacterized protein LOC120074722 isoform X1 n=1 Tax=Benincasa hispida TaxID=102211 RepID=UPI0018FF8AAB|nr:uncharacterized protein LOC120074722 isoform X1 [Benincasa hispida]